MKNCCRTNRPPDSLCPRPINDCGSNEEPIISYGIVTFFIKDDVPHILLYQRRDTFGYVDIVKGFWNTEDDLKRLFSLTTKEERKRLENHSFDEIWNDIWVNHSNYIYQTEFKKCKEKFKGVRHFIDSDTYKSYSFNKGNKLEWGFPKGKRNRRESNYECASREFEEETNIKKDELILVNVEPIIEYYRGSDNRAYGTFYFLCEIKTQRRPKFIKLENRIRSRALSYEANNYKWFTIPKANRVLITHHKKILRKAAKRIQDIMNKRF